MLVPVSDNRVSTIHGRNSMGVEGSGDVSEIAPFGADSSSLLKVYKGKFEAAGRL